MNTKTFIDQKAFRKLLDQTPNEDGTPYTNPDKIYRDLSRLVVVWLYRTNKSELQKVYREGGWKSPANIVPIQKCAEKWLASEQPKLLKKK
jgi:hypothetical protein